MVRSSFNGKTEMMLKHGLQANLYRLVHNFNGKIDMMLKGALELLCRSNFNGKIQIQ